MTAVRLQIEMITAFCIKATQSVGVYIQIELILNQFEYAPGADSGFEKTRGYWG